MNRTIKLGLPGAFFGAWLIMIAVGVWHASAPTIPTIGYWPCLLIAFGIMLSGETVAQWTYRTTSYRRNSLFR